jgi:hypothetical protein
VHTRVQGFGENIEGRRPLGMPRHIWENNIKIDLCEVGWGMD